MKKTLLLNLIFITTLFLFSACSTKEVKPKSATATPSVYNIMGITEPKKEIVHFVVKNNTPKMKPYVAPTPQISPDIEFISYNQNQPMNFTTDTVAPYSISDIERNAKSFLGTPYVWGATGPSKFDCSGFTQWVFRDAGINIPRVSREQAKVGQYVRYENLQRGDMVFFDTKKRRTGKVCHVGIYLGNGDFIHASSSGKKVVIFNFNDKKFYKKRFLWGRRLTNSNTHYASN
jgi:cell wall-associated NlpC family hydrolase